jgi:type I restriction enzyme, S subunit
MGGWQKCKLGDLVEIKHGFAFSSAHFKPNGTHIVVTPGNFFDEGGFKDKGDNEKWYDGPIPEDYVLNKGSLIIAMTEQGEGLLGSAAIIPKSGIYLHNQRLGLIKVRDSMRVDERYLYYLFNSKPIRQQIRASASGVKIRHTSPSRVADVVTFLPPLSTQRLISDIVCPYDALIENNRRRVAILDAMARALYREWFVRPRFPHGENTPPTDSALGKVPQGWAIEKLAKIAEVNRAQISSRTAPPEVHYIDISSVSPGQIDQISRFRFGEAPNRARRIVKHGDVIWSCVRPNRRSHALILRPEPNTIASTGFAVLTARTVPFTFLYFATTTDDFVTFLANNATGSAYPAVSAKTFENADIVVPSQTSLREFDEMTRPIVDQSHTLRLQTKSLRSIRDMLLPQLLSGEMKLATD